MFGLTGFYQIEYLFKKMHNIKYQIYILAVATEVPHITTVPSGALKNNIQMKINTSFNCCNHPKY